MLAGPPVVHTAPSHHGFASVLCSLFSSVTLSKPHTPLFLALPVVPWHSPLRQHVGLGIKNRPAHIFLGLNFPARLWLTVFLTGFFLSYLSVVSVMGSNCGGVGRELSRVPLQQLSRIRSQWEVAARLSWQCSSRLALSAVFGDALGKLGTPHGCPSWISVYWRHSSSSWHFLLLPPVSPTAGAVPVLQVGREGASSILINPKHSPCPRASWQCQPDVDAAGGAAQAGRAWEWEWERVRARVDLPLVTPISKRSQAAGDQPFPVAPAAKIQFAQLDLSLALWPPARRAARCPHCRRWHSSLQHHPSAGW